MWGCPAACPAPGRFTGRGWQTWRSEVGGGRAGSGFSTTNSPGGSAERRGAARSGAGGDGAARPAAGAPRRAPRCLVSPRLQMGRGSTASRYFQEVFFFFFLLNKERRGLSPAARLSPQPQRRPGSTPLYPPRPVQPETWSRGRVLQPLFGHMKFRSKFPETRRAPSRREKEAGAHRPGA